MTAGIKRFVPFQSSFHPYISRVVLEADGQRDHAVAGRGDLGGRVAGLRDEVDEQAGEPRIRGRQRDDAGHVAAHVRDPLCDGGCRLAILRAEFEARTGALVGQYNEFMPFDDLAVNGEFTLGENIGDLGGITIGLLAYKMSLDGEEPPVIDGYTGLQRVFLGFGQVWRGIIRDEELRRRIATDPHSPAIYRTNGPVRNVPEWYEAFEVAETDALYLPPEERVKIW